MTGMNLCFSIQLIPPLLSDTSWWSCDQKIRSDLPIKMIFDGNAQVKNVEIEESKDVGKCHPIFAFASFCDIRSYI